MSFKKDGEIKVYQEKNGSLKTASEKNAEGLERYTVDRLVEDCQCFGAQVCEWCAPVTRGGSDIISRTSSIKKKAK
jgi:hypothetical protein